MDIQIVLPPISEDYISSDLRDLTKAICGKTGEEAGCGLGGEFGYAIDFENNIFKFHPYCWCDREECPYCGGCNCPNSAYHYFVDNNEASEKEYENFYIRETYQKFYPEKEVEWLKDNWLLLEKTGGKNHSVFMELSRVANTRRTVKKDKECDFCLEKGIWEKYKTTHGFDVDFGTPLFWYKKSNFKVKWYKYIGRDMEFNKEISKNEWWKIFEECLKSV